MPNIHETIKQLEISAGGPGSGRHVTTFSRTAEKMHDHLLNNGFVKTGNDTGKLGTGQGIDKRVYAHPDGRHATVGATGTFAIKKSVDTPSKYTLTGRGISGLKQVTKMR